MHIPASKRVTVVLTLVCAGLLVWGSCLIWRYGWLSIRVALASEQTQIFEDMRLRALQSTASEAADCLQYAVDYYPSGTKQEAGSRLDRMVERERQQAVNEILVYLREKTGEDLGKEPSAWIQKYDRK